MSFHSRDWETEPQSCPKSLTRGESRLGSPVLGGGALPPASLSLAWPGRSRPSLQDCLAHPWLQDAYLMKLRRQTLTFTTNRLKEFLGEQRRRRAEAATRHKVLLRSYPGSP